MTRSLVTAAFAFGWWFAIVITVVLALLAGDWLLRAYRARRVERHTVTLRSGRRATVVVPAAPMPWYVTQREQITHLDFFRPEDWR